MAKPQNRKRQRADDSSRDKHPAKRSKPTIEPHRASNFSPAFWNHLSKVWLTPRALRELDRRNSTRPPTTAKTPDVVSIDLARFARHGGPDIRHLRGYPEPHCIAGTMASSSSQSDRTQSTKPTTVSSKARKSSAYDDDFEQHLIDNNIYPEGHSFPDDRSTPEPEDAERLRQDLSAARSSLSPSKFSESDFREFRRKNKTRSEGTVMRTVIPIIAGNANIPNEGHLPFTNLDSLTDEATVKAVPDFFDGACPGSVNKTVSRALNQVIIPTKHADVPVVPNLFLEVKAPKGGADVALRQACYDGAYGARAMHGLQNYGEAEPGYDGNAYTFSSTFHDGTLKLFAHHVRPPAEAETQPEYHMTQLDGWQMTGNIDTFRRGATSFRNARDLAKQYRDRFIQTANARASQIAAIAEHVAKRDEDELPSSDKLADRADCVVSQDAHDARIANASDDSSQDGSEVLAVPHYLDTEEEDSQDPGQQSAAPGFDNPSMSFASSFTSILSGDPIPSKRPKHSLSPRSKFTEPHRSKSRTRPSTTRRSAESPTQAAGSAQLGSSEAHQVKTYVRDGNGYSRGAAGLGVQTELDDWHEQGGKPRTSSAGDGNSQAT